jgi:hypothetical protein
MRGRAITVTTAVVVLVVLSPALRSSARDGFPLSNYPMFATDVGRKAVVDTAMGLRADGTAVTLSPRLVSGTDEVILAASTVSNAVAAGPERSARLCTEIAARIGSGQPDVVEIRIATETVDAVRWFDGDTTPATAAEVRATCPVPGR